MGKAKSYEMIEYRNKITNAIITCEELVSLLGSTMQNAIDELPYSIYNPSARIFPHENIPNTLTEIKNYINFDLRATIDFRNPVYKDITLWFFIMCHKDVEMTNKGLWYDRAACHIDELFTDQNILGVGTTTIVSNTPYNPIKDFHGRMLTFTVKDFTKGNTYGK